MGTKIILTGDNIVTRKERILVISNHRTRLDWMFLWGFFFYEGWLRHLKIIMKIMLKRIPIFGWPMQTANFIFLNRDFEKDRSYIADVIQFMSGMDYPPQILLFPEGTDKTPDTTKRSDEWAKKNNLKQLNYTLHPRSTGFIFILNLMKKYKLIDSVYDLTIGYMDHIPQNEISIIKGFPKEFHVHLKRYPIHELPENDKDLEKWLSDIWYEKDYRLEQFYNQKKFTQGTETPHVPLHNISEVQATSKLVTFLWIFFTSIAFYLFINYSLFFWYTVMIWVVLQAISLHSGLHIIEMNVWSSSILKNKPPNLSKWTNNN